MSHNPLPKDHLAPGWVHASAIEVCEKIQDGTHFSPKTQHQAGPFPYVTAKNVKPGRLELAGLTYLEEKEHREIYSRCDVRLGDVLLVKDGVNAGDVAVNTLRGEISLLSSVCFLRPNPFFLEPAFLMYYLQSSRGRAHLLGRLSGTAIRRIILKRIKETEVVVAPISEQRAISSTLDSYFTRLDDAEATLERVKRNLERYRASVLEAAVEGRLVPTESELARQAERIAPNASSLLGLPEKGPHSVGVPDGWCWTTVGQVQESMKNGIYKSAEHYDNEGTACLRMYNIERGEIVWKNVKRMRLTREEIAEYRLLPGDLLVNRVNSRELVGKAAVFPAGMEECVFESKNIRLRARAGVARPRYLSYVFEVYGREYFNRNAQQVVGMASISQPQVAGLRFQLPPMPEQLRVVRAVDRRLTVGRRVAGEIDDMVRRLQALRQSVLRMAFNGRLVDQDPTDEAASILLQRIRVERVKAATAPEAFRRRDRPRKGVKK